MMTSELETSPKQILITGATGTLGRAFDRICEARGLPHHVTDRRELDISERSAVEAAFDRLQPWLVINAAGYVRVDDAEDDVERCLRENALGPENLARSCARHGVQLVSFSSDLVFDGKKGAPYDEHDPPAPLGVYGRSKHESESRVLDAHPGALVVRTSAFFGPWDAHNFVTITLRELAAGREVRAARDLCVTATYLPDLVHACLDLGIDGEHGLWHLANSGVTSWADLARAAAELAGHRADRVVPVPSHELRWRARRPRFSALGSRRGMQLPALHDALQRYQVARTQENR